MSEHVYRCSPGDLLASFLSNTKQNRALYLLLGTSGSGKTSWCLDLVNQVSRSGLKVGGLLSPAIFAGDQKIGIDLLDLTTQEKRRLASRPPNQGENELCTGAWCLDQATLAWGNQCLQKQPEPDILILDEIGPLEFTQKKGLLTGLDLVDSGSYRMAIVTIRPSLLEKAQQRWPHSQVIEITEYKGKPGGES